ncbi:MAG: 50S ribosomal protein L11 methyltransferase, partial [Candidatus Aminicenantes bacterium]|nr:50S ribosomal protein L11 methyltransferase [Candidatus Aminicenantes bacterium]
GRIPIILAAGAAFGSGEHETTASCLEEMERRAAQVAGAEVLDLGCGTGVLAVAAAKLGASRVVAIDPSPDAVAAAAETAGSNGVESRVEVLRGDIGVVRGRSFDVVLANLYADVLLTIPAALAAALRPGAALVLSGINDDAAFDVQAAFEHRGLLLVRRRALEEFWTLVFVRPPG